MQEQAQPPATPTQQQPQPAITTTTTTTTSSSSSSSGAGKVLFRQPVEVVTLATNGSTGRSLGVLELTAALRLVYSRADEDRDLDFGSNTGNHGECAARTDGWTDRQTHGWLDG